MIYAAGLLSYETGAAGARPAANSQETSGASASADFYFSGRLFGEKYPSFGAELSGEEIEDRYGLSD